MKRAIMCLLVLLALVSAGCSTPARRMRNMRLGMTPDEVRKKVGDPYTVRAAKSREDGTKMLVWEYIARFALYPKDYWVYFENDRVVQWGEPGDFSMLLSDAPPVLEYVPNRVER